jgi:hypothetical protein
MIPKGNQSSLNVKKDVFYQVCLSGSPTSFSIEVVNC